MMKSTLARFLKPLLLLPVLTFFLLTTRAQDIPAKPDKLVNDYTQTLSADQVARLEQKLVAFDDATSTQIAVVILKSVGNYDIAAYADKLAETWGVGRTKKNNGVVLLIALNDKKMTIQTGYGVEGALPDAIARRIIENEIKPDFKAGDYFAGIDKGTDAIIAYTKGEYKNTDPKSTVSKKTTRSGSGIPSGVIIPIIIIIIIVISRRGGGGGGHIIGRRGGASPFWWLLAGSAMGRSSSDWGGFSGGSGGFGGGGSSGGGGFGGFGGGSFGGGGASGSW